MLKAIGKSLSLASRILHHERKIHPKKPRALLVMRVSVASLNWV